MTTLTKNDRRIEEIVNLNNNGIGHLSVDPQGLIKGDRTHDYNCWGLTAMIMGWTDKIRWIESFEMDELLEKNSWPVEKPEPGDIIVMRNTEDALVHTCVFLFDPNFSKKEMDSRRVIEKQGSSNFAIVRLEESKATYGIYGGTEITYRTVRGMKPKNDENQRFWFESIFG